MGKLRLQELLDRMSLGDSKVRLERIDVSDGTVGWDVIRGENGSRLGDIIRVERVKIGGQPRLCYYGRKEHLYLGREFSTKEQAIDYVANHRST